MEDSWVLGAVIGEGGWPAQWSIGLGFVRGFGSTSE